MEKDFDFDLQALSKRMLRMLAGGLVFFASASGLWAQALHSPDATAVVATRGSATVTLADIDAQLGNMPDDVRVGYLDDVSRASSLIDTILLNKQLTQAAENAKLDQSVEFTTKMKLVREQGLSKLEVDRYLATVSIPDFSNAAKERYAASKETYAAKPRVDVRHLVVLTDGVDEASALAKTQEAYERAVKGEDFDVLVKAYSGEPDSDKRGGWIRNVGAMQLDPKFTTALAALRNVGDISKPVRSKYGYHVIRLERRDEIVIPPFDEVKDKIIGELRAKYLDTQRSDYLSSFTAQPLKLNDEIVKTLPARYSTAKTK